MKMDVGLNPGERCNRMGCDGEISDFYHDMHELEHGKASCTCFIHAPCGKCDPIYSGRNHCHKCEWDSSEGN